MYTEVIWALVGLAGLGAVARSCSRSGQNPASEDTLHYYARGGRQARRRAFVDWSRLTGSSGKFRESPGSPGKFRLKRRELKRTELKRRELKGENFESHIDH